MIHFNDVALKAKRFEKEIIQAVSKVVESGVFFNGPQTHQLEKRLTTHLGGGFVTSVASGHDALTLALSALSLKSDDEVIFPVNVFPTAFPVALCGAKPVPVDVDKNGQLDPRKLAKKVNKKTKAIVLVHLYGLVGDLDAILDIAKRGKITLIEDCAQAFKSMYDGKPVGTFGDIGCFSFYLTKNLSTLGDGGALYTRDKRFYEFFLKAISYGEEKKYFSDFLSGHSRLPEIQAGILNLYFSDVRNNFRKRKEIASYYRKRLQEEDLLSYVRPLSSLPKSDPVPHLFVVETKERDGLRTHLDRRGIATHVHYPYPIHLMPAFSFLEKKLGDFPMAEKLSQNILSLPFHSFLSSSEINYIIKAIQEFYLD